MPGAPGESSEKEALNIETEAVKKLELLMIAAKQHCVLQCWKVENVRLQCFALKQLRYLGFSGPP